MAGSAVQLWCRERAFSNAAVLCIMLRCHCRVWIFARRPQRNANNSFGDESVFSYLAAGERGRSEIGGRGQGELRKKHGESIAFSNIGRQS